MDCLASLVGYRNVCGETTPNSIFYINDLPSLSIKKVDAAINDEYVSAKDMISKKITLAGDLIASKLRSYFNPRFKGASVISDGIVGVAYDNLQSVTAEPTYLIGKQVRIYAREYLEFFLSKVALHVNTTGNVSVYVYDLTQNKLLDTLTVSAVAGEISYADVYKSYKTIGQDLNLFIGYTASFDSYKTKLTGGCNTCNDYSNPYISFSSKKILSASSKLQQNLETPSGDGLILQYSVNCTFEPFVCSIKHLLAEAIWWKAGELLMQEARYSNRLNSLIAIYEKDHEVLMNAYKDACEQSLATNLQNMKIPDNECFYCNQKIMMRVAV